MCIYVYTYNIHTVRILQYIWTIYVHISLALLSPRLPLRLLCIHGIHRARDLRQDEMSGFLFSGSEPKEVSLAAKFSQILRDGPELGIHTIIWCDTLTNLSRSVDRRNFGEFAMRVVTQMSSEDSAGLIDSPLASKLGARRAVFYSEDEGRLEKFIPYAS